MFLYGDGSKSASAGNEVLFVLVSAGFGLLTAWIGFTAMHIACGHIGAVWIAHGWN